MQTIREGDVIRVSLRDGRTASFQVALVEPGVLVGMRGEHVATADIVTLERRRVSWFRTAALALSLQGVLMAAMLLVHLDREPPN